MMLAVESDCHTKSGLAASLFSSLHNYSLLDRHRLERVSKAELNGARQLKL